MRHIVLYDTLRIHKGCEGMMVPCILTSRVITSSQNLHDSYVVLKTTSAALAAMDP